MNAKNDVTKLACALQTILSDTDKCLCHDKILISTDTDKCLCHDCGNCEEILYEEEGEIDFDSDDEDDEEE